MNLRKYTDCFDSDDPRDSPVNAYYKAPHSPAFSCSRELRLGHQSKGIIILAFALATRHNFWSLTHPNTKTPTSSSVYPSEHLAWDLPDLL